MTDSIRERILNAIVAKLNTIYAKPWALRFDSRVPGASYPEAIVWRSSESTDETSNGDHDCLMSVYVIVSIDMATEQIDSVMDKHVTNVEQAVMEDETWDGLATQSFLKGSTIDPPIVGMEEYRARVELEVQYRRRVADPRTQ